MWCITYSIYALDLKEILTLALQTDPCLGEQTTMAIGLASAKNPNTLKGRSMPDVAFEWRIDLAQKSTVERLVTKWRGSVVGGSVTAYRTIKKNPDKQRKKDDLIRATALVEAPMLSQPDDLVRSYVPENQRAQPSPALPEGTPQTRKRSNLTLGEYTVAAPSRKRLSIGSQSARDPRAGAEPQSGMSFAGLLRPPPPTDLGNPSARSPVQRSFHTRTETSQRPGDSSSTIGRGKTYAVSGYHGQTSSSIGSSSRVQSPTNVPPMSGVTRGLSTLGLMSTAPTIGQSGRCLGQREPRQEEPRRDYRNEGSPSAPTQSRNISPALGSRLPRPLNTPRAPQASPDDRDFDRPTLRPLASHVYSNTPAPRQPPPRLRPLPIPPLNVPPRRTPPRSTFQPSANPPSMAPRGIKSSQDNRPRNQIMERNPGSGRYLPVPCQDAQLEEAPQDIRPGQSAAASVPHGPDVSFRTNLGGSRSG